MRLQVPDSCRHIFIIIMTAICATSESYRTRAACPDDVIYSTTQCLTHYNTLIAALDMRQETFYSGVDVETIRSICDALVSSMHCAHNIKINCPENEHSQIETVISDLKNIAELCSTRNLIEIYARNQYCYTRIQGSSETCYRAYQREVDDITSLIPRGDQLALRTMCTHFQQFVRCVRSHVEMNCGDQAAGLVESLVKPSVPYSERCTPDVLSTTTTTETPRSKVAREPTDRQGYSHTSSSGYTNMVSIATSLLCLVSSLLYAKL